MFRGHEPDKRHERTSGGEPSRVTEFDDENEGAERVDATEAPQAAHRGGIAGGDGKRFEVGVEGREPRADFVDRAQVVLVCRGQGGQGPGLRPHPLVVIVALGFGAEMPPAMAEQKRAEAAARADQVTTGIFTCPDQIACGLVGRYWARGRT